MLKLGKRIPIIILSLCVLLITILIGGYLITNFNSNDVLVDDFTSPIINPNTLTMMYET